MSRLIDADELKERFCEENCGKNRCIDHMDKCAWILSVEESKTAFDVDKVIEQIEHRRANFDCKLCKYNFDDEEKPICREDCSDALIDDLLEIVKGGGVE